MPINTLRSVSVLHWKDTLRSVILQDGCRTFPHGAADRGANRDRETEAGAAEGHKVHQLILDAAIEMVFESGFRAVSIESIAAKTGVAKTTIYRRWPNKAAVVMDGFMDRVGSGTLFPPAETAIDRVRLQMRTMAKVFRGKDGGLVKAPPRGAQFDPELAKEFRERWSLPRRKLRRRRHPGRDP